MTRADIRIGDAAEDLLTLLASEAGINIVEPKRDRRGWDRVFEFPHAEDYEAIEFLDRRPPEMVCQIQAKAIEGTRLARGSLSVKLDNLERFAKNPLPCFFVIFDYSTKPRPERAYVIHIDDQWIERILKRLRKEAAKPDAQEKKAVHKLSLDIRWAAEDELPEVSGKALAERIRRHVGHYPAYVQKKLSLIENAGYGAVREHVSLAIEGDDQEQTFELLADVSLGLRSDIPVRVLQHSDVRFDIPIPIPGIDGTTSLAFPAPAVDGSTTVTITDARGLKDISFECTTYASMMLFPFLPRKHWKVRCVAPFVSFVLPVYEGDARCMLSTGDLDSRQPLYELERLAELVRILDESEGKTLRLTIKFDLRGHRHVEEATARAPTLDQTFTDLAAPIRHATRLCRLFGLPGAPSAVPLALYGQRFALGVLDAALTGRTVQSRTAVSVVPKSGDRVVQLASPSALVGDHVLVAILGLDSAWELQDRPHEPAPWLIVSGTPPKIVFKQAVRREDWPQWSKEVLPKKLAAACKVAEDAGADQVYFVAD